MQVLPRHQCLVPVVGEGRGGNCEASLALKRLRNAHLQFPIQHWNDTLKAHVMQPQGNTCRCNCGALRGYFLSTHLAKKGQAGYSAELQQRAGFAQCGGTQACVWVSKVVKAPAVSRISV